MKQYVIAFLVFLSFSHLAYGEKLATDEKVKRVYELYLQDNTVTLDKNAWRMGLNLSYLHDEKTFGFSHQETRGVSGQVSINYGVVKNVELYASLPVLWNSQSFSDALFFQ